jgi:hypothetical protein
MMLSPSKCGPRNPDGGMPGRCTVIDVQAESVSSKRTRAMRVTWLMMPPIT